MDDLGAGCVILVTVAFFLAAAFLNLWGRPMCKHESFDCAVTVNRLEDVGRFCADVTIKCIDCGTPFRFIGLPHGLDLNGAAVSPDGSEARLAIAPKGEVLTMLDGVTGFTARRTK